MTAATLDPTPFRRALAEEPQGVVAWQKLGLLTAASGDVDAALKPLRRATSVAPSLPAPWENLGLAFGALGRWGEAAAAYAAAFALRSNRADIAARLAEAHGRAGQFAESIRAFDRAIQLSPTDARLRNERGMMAAMSGSPDSAIADLHAALAAEPGTAPTYYMLAQCLFRLGRLPEAERRFAHVLAIDAVTVDPLINLSVLAQGRHENGTARRLLRRAVARSPGNATAHGNLGVLEMSLGEMTAAVRQLRRGVDLAPDQVEVHSNLLLALGYVEIDHDHYFAEHRRWEARHAASAYAFIRPCDNDADPDRQLRVGYLSADFFDHALGTNIAGLIRHHDRREVEVTCYAEIGRPDDMTAYIRDATDRFVETQALDDAALAERIRTDRIDILVVLAGHTARNRITAAARKPAPILVSYADFSTTGLSVMDYWLTDPVIHPEDTAERFTETLMRIPMMVLHQPINVAPPVSALPAPQRGHVTFGSFNNPAKIGEAVIDLWARLLVEVPTARLVLKYRKIYELPDVRDGIAGRFAAHGVDPARVIFAGEDLNRSAHLALVGEIDVALDPFPFNGCTTTFEALWMGVPVVTLAGSRFLGRMGASFLTHLGLPELVAKTPDEFVRTAVGLASDLARLDALRTGMRARIMASPLCDGPAYARSIEKAFRSAWRNWCGTRR